MFSRPVDPLFDIKCHYAEKSPRFDWTIDQDNGIWIPIQDQDGKGMHHGTDFDCPTGTIVRAMVDGLVVRSGFESSTNDKVGKGLHIVQLVQCPGYDSWSIRYSHLKASYVKPGQKIFRFDPIAESGESGDAKTPYLHVDLMNLKYQWKPIPF